MLQRNKDGWAEQGQEESCVSIILPTQLCSAMLYYNTLCSTRHYYNILCSTMLFNALLYEATISPPFPLISCWRPGHHLFKSITEQHQTLENVLFQNHRKHYIYRQSLGNILSGTPLDGFSPNMMNNIMVFLGSYKLILAKTKKGNLRTFAIQKGVKP